MENERTASESNGASGQEHPAPEQPAPAAPHDQPIDPDTPEALNQEMLGYLENNKAWSVQQLEREPQFFKKLVHMDPPTVFWVGCAESRVPANDLLGLAPGEVFVQRNVGNIVNHKDFNCMSCLEYAVKGLKVRHIIVCGHYGCGAVKAALTMPCKTSGLVNLWIQDVRSIRDKHADTLRQLKGSEPVDKLVELNVVRQVFNVCTSPIVQKAWDMGQPLAVHGVIYNIADGILKPIGAQIAGLEDLDRYNHDQMDMLRHLSLSVLDQGSFEREAIIWGGQKRESIRYPNFEFDD